MESICSLDFSYNFQQGFNWKNPANISIPTADSSERLDPKSSTGYLIRAVTYNIKEKDVSDRPNESYRPKLSLGIQDIPVMVGRVMVDPLPRGICRLISPYKQQLGWNDARETEVPYASERATPNSRHTLTTSLQRLVT